MLLPNAGRQPRGGQLLEKIWGYILVQLVHKFFHTNLPQAGFELRSLGPQAGVLPIEPPLLVGLI